jgi:hypothetical protein
LIVITILASIPIGACVGIWYLASLYDKRPKVPGQIEIERAEDFIGAFKNIEAGGNAQESIEAGAEFARSLRIARGMLIEDGKPGFGDMTNGRFLTYCFLTKESAAFIVHVPGIRNFSESAKLTLEESAWTIATQTIRANNLQVKQLALGIKGDLNYSSILTGTVNLEDPLKGIEVHHPTVSDEALWPYFIASGKSESK